MAEHNEQTIAHMNMIQGVVTRLETNCFTLKAMAMTIAAALLAFIGTLENPNWVYPIAAILPIIVFWIMDAQYLRLGRCFRRLFDTVRKHECKEPFSMDISNHIKAEKSVFKIMFTWSAASFYGIILVTFLFITISFLTNDILSKAQKTVNGPASAEIRALQK